MTPAAHLPLHLVERFLAGCRLDPDYGDKLGIAVSGGPDSLALLLLAHSAMPGRIRAATVDHGLRAEARAEAAFVAEICADLGVPHAILPVDLEPGNTQAMARAARYEALGSHFASERVLTFATAHHADDQAETLLMRLNRASGLAGLAGVRPWSIFFPVGVLAEMLLLRPLLGWRREELAKIVNDAGIVPVNDPSNTDDAFERARMRKAIADLDWLDPLAMARSARYLAEAEEVVEDAVHEVLQRCCTWEDGGCYFQWGHPRLVEIGAVANILDRLGARDCRKSEVARMVDRLRTRENASLGGVLGRRMMHRVSDTLSRDVMRFEPEPPRNS